MNNFNPLSSDYEQIKPENVLLDPKNNTILDPNDPLTKIKTAAKMMNIAIKDPKKDCKKCYGRGYTGTKVATGEPVPCICIFEKKDQLLNFPIKYNRKQRRELERKKRRIFK